MAEHGHREVKLLDRVELEGWSSEHVETELARLHLSRARRAQGRRRALVIGSVVSVAATLVLLVWAGGAFDAAPAATMVLPATPARPTSDVPGTQRFADGSRAIPIGPASELTSVIATEAEVRVRLVRGSGSFDVTPNRARRFVVEVGSLQVIVLGTSFGVERRAGEAHVHVTRGLVRVRWPSGEALLPAGAEGTFPCELEDVPPNASATSVAGLARGEAVPPPVPSPGSEASPARTWRELARAADSQAAYQAILAGAPVGDTVDDQMLAADVVRRSGHPANAIPYLRRVWEAHPSHPQAALASFTAGRLLLRSGQPAAAAEAFARVRRLTPSGSLSEDALAREAEAWAQAGHPDRATLLAHEYERRYPNGRRAAEVRRLGAVP